jgi:hypothetical protein
LNQSTAIANKTIPRKLQFLRVGKNAFHPVVNFKHCLAAWAGYLPGFSFNAKAKTKWTFQNIMKLRIIHK